jgi:RHS repeat-associated protein
MITAAKSETPFAQLPICAFDANGFVFSLAASSRFLPETRVWGSDFENRACIGAAAWLSSTTRWGCGYSCDGTVSGSLDQRFYASTYGRFNTPDPYQGSAKGASDPNNPGSWNRYAYVQGDPVNAKDPRGLFLLTAEIGDDFDDDGDDDWDGGWNYYGPVYYQPQKPQQPTGGGASGRPIDYATDKVARATLNTRLANFGSTNCDKVFNSVIQGFSASGFAGTANSTQFYNTTNPSYSGDTQNQVSGNGSGTTLGASFVPGLGASAMTISGSLGAVVLLGGDFFANTNATYQSNVLLHELLHAYTGWSDADIFSAFAAYGLKQTPFGGTENISAWLSTDCTKTPTTFNWWSH